MTFSAEEKELIEMALRVLAYDDETPDKVANECRALLSKLAE